MTATIDRIIQHLHHLEAIEPAVLVGVELIVKDAIAIRTGPTSKRTLDARLRAVHPGCDGGFVQQPPHSGRRSWRCETCGTIVTLESK